MEEYLLIDGYNIINSWPQLIKLKNDNLESARIKLIEMLQNYQGTQDIHIIIVFDAHLAKSKMRTRTSLNEGKVQILYTKAGETADALIERMTGELPIRSKVTVVTNDWDEQRTIFGKGALRMTTKELFYNINDAEEVAIRRRNIEHNKKRSIEDRLHDKVKKKLEELRCKASEPK